MDKISKNSRNRKIFRTFINVCSYTTSYVTSKGLLETLPRTISFSQKNEYLQKSCKPTCIPIA